MKISSKLLAVSLLTGVSFNVMAGGSAGSGPNPFVDCGIGAALFPNTHWAAVTSNVIWDIGTTAVISATASPETCSGKNAQAAIFIRDTYPTLIEDTARGEGEHLTALLEIYGCSSESRTDISQSVRSAVSEKVSADNYSKKDRLQKASDYYDAFNGQIEANFAQSCSA